MSAHYVVAAAVCAGLIAAGVVVLQPLPEQRAPEERAVERDDQLANSQPMGELPQAENGVAAERQAMDLRLVGTIVNSPEQFSIAMIATPAIPEGKLYRIGDELPDGSALAAVYESEAHLELAGTNRILYIEGLGADTEAAFSEASTDTALGDSGYRGSYEDAQFNDQLMSE